MKKKNSNDIPANKKHFYYLRDEHGLPRVTVCLIHFTEEDIVCRGLSICSPLDQPTKKLGNVISAGRAIKAYKLRRNCRPISRDEAFYNLELLRYDSYLTLPNRDTMYKGGVFKCYFSPKLTDYETAFISSTS